MHRSIVITEGDGPAASSAAAFVDALTRDLKAFGRDDVALVSVGGLKVFVWNPLIGSNGSNELRETAMAYRLRGQRAALEAMEARLDARFFEPFDVDLVNVEPEVVVCVDDDDKRLFDYLVWGQSMAADIKNFRNAKVLVFDTRPTPKRVMGAILLKSPMYFDGARDNHLGWPPLFDMVDGAQVKNQAAIDLRNQALKSIYNIGVCMLASPYTAHGMGKLIASLCFSPPIIEHLERTFRQPVLGMTTTGGWGSNAAQYDRLQLASRADGGMRPVYVRTHGARPSLNFPTHLFSAEVIDRAVALVRADNSVSIRVFDGYGSDPRVMTRVFRQACKLIGLPIRATASNRVAHYFGSVSDDCTTALSTIGGIDTPPLVRTIPVRDALGEWRRRQKINGPVRRAVSAARLSLAAT